MSAVDRGRDVSGRLAPWLIAAMPAVLFGLRLWAGVCLALFVAFALQLDNPGWAGTSAAIVAQPVLGASLRKGIFRLVGTVIGAVATVLLTAIVPQDRLVFFLCVALWCAGCSFASTVLRNFAAYAATLAGYTLVIIASSSIAAPDQVFILAVSRASEIAVGIVCGMGVMALTAFGDTAQRMAGALRGIVAAVLTGVRDELEQAGTDAPDTRPVRRALLARIVALDPMLDQAVGESVGVGRRRATLRAAVYGLLLSLSAWRTISAHLRGLAPDEARRLAGRLRAALPAAPPAGPAVPVAERDALLAASAAAGAAVAQTGSERLGLDRIATVLDGLGRALNGVVLLFDTREALPIETGPPLLLPDILPPLANAARVFVAVAAATLLVIATSWSLGYTFLTFVAVTTLLMSPQNEQAGKAIVGFGIGTMLTVALAAVTKFALLPNHEGFASFALVIGAVLVPLAALSTRPRFAGILVPATMNFIPLLGPTNVIGYDTAVFANSALAIAGGCFGGAVVLRVLPPVPRAVRTRRLLARTLHDLRGAMRRPGSLSPDAWRRRVYGRVVALPANADPAAGTRLLAALTVGLQMISLRQFAAEGGFGSTGAAEAALARGSVRDTQAALRALPLTGTGSADALRAEVAVREIVETLGGHADYFGAEGS